MKSTKSAIEESGPTIFKEFMFFLDEYQFYSAQKADNKPATSSKSQKLTRQTEQFKTDQHKNQNYCISSCCQSKQVQSPVIARATLTSSEAMFFFPEKTICTTPRICSATYLEDSTFVQKILAFLSVQM